MAGVDLKAYTSRAKELEAAIYTQRRLMEECEVAVKELAPRPPQQKKIAPPVKPLEPETLKTKTPVWGKVLFVLIGVVLFALGLIALLGSEAWMAALTVVGCGVWFFSVPFVRNREADDKEEEYYRAVEEYPKLLNEYYAKVQETQKENLIAMSAFQSASQSHEARARELAAKHSAALRSLESALAALYSENIVFPKYRNLVAITMINEYLISGRCYSLDGPDGAYNLYEMELRQNIIIGQLSSIIGNMEQIRNNQFSLYQELTKTNYTVNEILYEVKELREDTKQAAYFAKVAAIAETSPKFYYGYSV